MNTILIFGILIYSYMTIGTIIYKIRHSQYNTKFDWMLILWAVFGVTTAIFLGN